MYPDHYIDHWGEIFTANPCLRRACTFEQFLAQPRRIINGLVGRTLLPKQRAIQARLDSRRSVHA